jgi:hypothetical protein
MHLKIEIRSNDIKRCVPNNHKMSSEIKFHPDQLNVQELIQSLQRLVKLNSENAYLPVYTVEFGSSVPCCKVNLEEQNRIVLTDK